MTSKNFRELNYLTPYNTWAIQDTEASSKNVNEFGINLLETEINDDASVLVKREESSSCNSALVMDLGLYVVS
jgi:hypothetical protein